MDLSLFGGHAPVCSACKNLGLAFCQRQRQRQRANVIEYWPSRAVRGA